jgi:long-chain acyl-CoA synthetase
MEDTEQMKEPIAGRGILDYFLKWEKSTPDAVFLRQPIGHTWKEYSWKEAGHEARKLVSLLRQLNVAQGSKVGLWSGNCAEWIITDLALMMGGYVSVPIYANVNADSLRSILLHSDSTLLIIGKIEGNVRKQLSAAIPDTIRILDMPGYPSNEMPGESPLMESDQVPIQIYSPSLDDLQTIIYTSGTTGTPKGVMHTYSTIIHAVHTAVEVLKLNKPGNRLLSYLPLSHAAERGLVEFGVIYCGGSISFVESVEQFSATIREVKPTHFLGVPRVWQKFKEGILQKISQQKINLLLHIPIVSGWLKKKIRSSLGLGECQVMLSGAAPITVELLTWFQRIGIPIQEAYGLSEDFNVCSITPAEDIRIGMTGKIFPNQEVIILPDTHEIIQRSAWIMKGYYKDPELTAKTIQNGYFYTGDMGEIVDGYLKITGRVKDIFKTAKGEYIAPFPIESVFLALEEVDQACVLGSRYPQPFILVVLSAYGKSLDKEIVEEKLAHALMACNENSMGYQRLKKVIIVRDEWTTENNMLTLTMKMKRNAVAERYEEKLEPMYSSDVIIDWENIYPVHKKLSLAT